MDKECVCNNAKYVCKATLVFERFTDYRAFLNSIGVSTSEDMSVDMTVLMPHVEDEGQSRLDV